MEIKNLVSVIIVSKNAKNTIRRCLDSILNQTYPNIEIVVVDSSNDETKDILEKYKEKSKFPFRIIHQEPKGVGVARNTGLKNSHGEVIIWADTDIYFPPDYIEKIAKHFNDSKKVLGVYTKLMVKSSSKSLFVQLITLYEDIMFSGPPIYESGVYGLHVLRKDIYNKFGGFDENLEACEDDLFWSNLHRQKHTLESEGYIFPRVDITFFEEKRDQTFAKYYKKCIWYGKPLTNINYLRSKLEVNLTKIIGAIYITLFPFLLLLAIIFKSQFLFISLLIPAIGLFLYIIYRAITKKIITWKVILLPAIIYYKSFWTFFGIVIGLFTHKRNIPKLQVSIVFIFIS